MTMVETWVITAAPQGDEIYNRWGVAIGDNQKLQELYNKLSTVVFDKYFEFGESGPKTQSSVNVDGEELKKTEWTSYITGYRFGKSVEKILPEEFRIWRRSGIFKNRTYSRNDIPFGEAVCVSEPEFPLYAARISQIYNERYHWSTKIFKQFGVWRPENELDAELMTDSDDRLISTIKKMQSEDKGITTPQ